MEFIKGPKPSYLDLSLAELIQVCILKATTLFALTFKLTTESLCESSADCFFTEEYISTQVRSKENADNNKQCHDTGFRLNKRGLPQLLHALNFKCGIYRDAHTTYHIGSPRWTAKVNDGVLKTEHDALLINYDASSPRWRRSTVRP